ncbi:glycosyl transferase, wecb/taga/cpsf family, putative [Heliomicrobium modesticaldum Ice1]|uniref:Glycosyl transferase, wecb/taga/cpsf family, putative n=1 Tax=Heliobacterium modesticaldum (strain ATCC 51547 / Ice1) TaxID=498761 RepID=B0THL3_HELMI|nr:WecB/TagA/CpsF family glycosyltransferase [Heliomicrobium modesticaldum]ABZ83451.1 glycosyl transferase, wecb/taga/cpsf family, putative [Heliomicrobium modesticaldum Ice1]
MGQVNATERFQPIETVNILGTPVHRLSMADTVMEIEKRIEAGGRHQIITANPEILYHAYKDPYIQQLLTEASLVTADGIGVVWAASLLGKPVPERVTGIDLMSVLLNRAAEKKWPCFFYGGRPGRRGGSKEEGRSVAEEAARRLCDELPGLLIAGTAHGYLSAAEQAALHLQIEAAKPRLLFVGLGAPRQEQWIRDYLRRTPLRDIVAIGIGGSLDVFAGRAQRAPQWCQKWHMEWLYRLIKEPARWRRQLNLPRFVWAVLRQGKE